MSAVLATAKNVISSTTSTAIAGTALNGMANNALVLGGAINWTQGNTGDGYPNARLQLKFKFQVAPATNTGFDIWILKSEDGGTSYEEGGTGGPPCRPPDLKLMAHPFGGSGDTAAHTVSQDIDIPVGSLKFLMKDSATGQSLTASNTDNVLEVTPISGQQVSP